MHAASKGEYGWPRVWRELRANSVRVWKERIRRLMKEEHDIKARRKRKFIVTTDSKHSLPIAPNLLNRNFHPDAPNCVWTSDITYIQTDTGWLYLAVVLDLYSCQVVGWMEHATPYAEQLGNECTQNGLVQTTTRIGIHLPLGSRQSVLQLGISEHTG